MFVRCLYRAGSLMAVAKEISKYKLDLVGMQNVGWERSDTEEGKCTLLWKGE
jgi:hypothetical protein